MRRLEIGLGSLPVKIIRRSRFERLIRAAYEAGQRDGARRPQQGARGPGRRREGGRHLHLV